MIAAGVKQNASTSAALLEAFCVAKGPEAALPVLRGLLDYKEPIDSHSYVVLMKAFLQKAQPKQALKVSR